MGQSRVLAQGETAVETGSSGGTQVSQHSVGEHTASTSANSDPRPRPMAQGWMSPEEIEWDNGGSAGAAEPFEVRPHTPARQIRTDLSFVAVQKPHLIAFFYTCIHQHVAAGEATRPSRRRTSPATSTRRARSSSTSSPAAPTPSARTHSSSRWAGEGGAVIARCFDCVGEIYPS